MQKNLLIKILVLKSYRKDQSEEKLDLNHSNQTLENLNISKESVLLILEKNGRQSRKDIQVLLNTTPYQVRKLLQSLIEEGKVRKIGNSVSTQYEKY